MERQTYSEEKIQGIIKKYAPESEDLDIAIEGLHARAERLEALLPFLRDTLHFAMSEITEREDFRQQAQEGIDRIDAELEGRDG